MLRPRLTPRFLLCAFLLCAGDRSVVQGRTAAQVAGGIRRAVSRHAVAGARVGIVVRRLSDNTEIFSLAGHGLFDTASNTKLFTTAAALRRLGPDYEFRTAVIANGLLDNGVLAGDLVVVGGGDPNISGRFQGGDAMTAPRAISAAVQRAGIREIAGDLVMDDRLFDRVHRPAGWAAEDPLLWFAAPVSALSFNDNCVDISVKGGKRPGDPALVTSSPAVQYVKVINRCATCRSARSEGVTFERDATGAILVGGRIRAKKVRPENITISNPPLYLAAAIRTELNRLGIKVRGVNRLVEPQEKPLPEAREIYVWRSSLLDAIDVANRRSRNFHAEQILKTLGAAEGGIGTFDSGTAAVKRFLQEVGIPLESVSVADGSGLSPGNRATPAAIVRLLAIMYRGKLRDVFYNSLAVSGEAQTTLRNRMNKPPLRGRIHAKTGTISSRGVKALSGYAEATDGEVYAFSILVNGKLNQAAALQDAVCAAIVGGKAK